MMRAIFCKAKLLLFVGVLCLSEHAFTAEEFVINFGAQQEPETIGDIKPKFVAYKEKQLPDVSIEYVMKRYRKLFETSLSADVRIDALNRLNNLSASYGIVSDNLTIKEQDQGEIILETYDSIVEHGTYYNRMDELLYQTAKATSFTGDALETIRRLKLLAGLYPDSPLVAESYFRIAENYFELADFGSAIEYYSKALKNKPSEQLYLWAHYKRAWSNYRVEDLKSAIADSMTVFSKYPRTANLKFDTYFSEDMLGATTTRQTKASNASNQKARKRKGGKATGSEYEVAMRIQMLDDALRLNSIILDKQGGAAAIERLAERPNYAPYTKMLYRGLVAHHLTKKRYLDAGNIAMAFSKKHLMTPGSFDFAEKSIALYLRGDLDIDAWNARSELVDLYGLRSSFWASASAEVKADIRVRLSTVVDELAHLNFVRMQQAKTKTQLSMGNAKKAAAYYLEWASLNPGQEKTGEAVYLAAVSLDYLGRTEQALAMYERSAYKEPEHAYREKSAYQSLLSYQTLQPEYKMWNQARVTAIQTFANKFPASPHAFKLSLQLANYYLSLQDKPNALAVAQQSLAFKPSTAEEEYQGLKLSADLSFELELYEQSFEYYSLMHKLSTKHANAHPEWLVQSNDGKANSLYRLAQQSDEAGDKEQAITHYLALVDVLPQNELASYSLFDAASGMIALQKWADSIATLDAFIESYPDHALTEQVLSKQVFVHEKTENHLEAANSLLALHRVAAAPELAKNSLYQAAQYYAQAGFTADAMKTYQDFIDLYPEASDLGLEARHAVYSHAGKDVKQAGALLAYVALFEAPSVRVKTLGAQVAYDKAVEECKPYYAAKLNQPFNVSLKNKQRLLKLCAKSYEKVIGYEIKDYQDAARFQMGNVYRNLSKDIITSERPSGLSELELEQYGILLEEQAYPAEEQAISFYEENVSESYSGKQNIWVHSSFNVLAEMNPSRYHRPLKRSAHAEQH